MTRFLAWMAALAVIVFGVVKCSGSDWYQREQADARAQQIARETPHVIRDSGDGCKVYAFEAGGRTHYFTRCPDSRTTTESSWTETCGKNCHRTITESIPN
jgi:hypothetical protein